MCICIYIYKKKINADVGFHVRCNECNDGVHAHHVYLHDVSIVELHEHDVFNHLQYTCVCNVCTWCAWCEHVRFDCSWWHVWWIRDSFYRDSQDRADLLLLAILKLV